MAQLQAVIAELRTIDDATVTRAVRQQLAAAARPFAPAVRAAILNTPATKGKHTGLRARIAACVQTFAVIQGDLVSVGVKVNAARMPDGEHSLPLMLNGDKIWRHPLFGDRERWYGQESHPFFAKATALMGPASQKAVDRAVGQLADRVNNL